MYSLPGQRTGRSSAPREVLKSTVGVRYGRGQLDSTKAYDGANTNYEDELRVGYLLGRISASGLYRGLTRTRANGAGAATATLVVDDARTFKAGDTITVGANTGCVISSINYSTNTITLSATKTWSDRDVVFCQDGSGTFAGILGEFVKLKDEDAVFRDKYTAHIIIAGHIRASQVIGDLASTQAIRLTLAAVSAALEAITFDTDIYS